MHGCRESNYDPLHLTPVSFPLLLRLIYSLTFCYKIMLPKTDMVKHCARVFWFYTQTSKPLRVTCYIIYQFGSYEYRWLQCPWNETVCLCHEFSSLDSASGTRLEQQSLSLRTTFQSSQGKYICISSKERIFCPVGQKPDIEYSNHRSIMSTISRRPKIVLYTGSNLI